MLDKLKIYFDNHKWFRILFYIITFLIIIPYFFGSMIVFYHVSQTMNTIVEIDIYNATHMLCYGAGMGVVLFLIDMFEIFRDMYNIAMKHKD